MSNENATPDTPEERDDKAEVLAKELKKFRRETRIYYWTILAFILNEVFHIV